MEHSLCDALNLSFCHQQPNHGMGDGRCTFFSQSNHRDTHLGSHLGAPNDIETAPIRSGMRDGKHYYNPQCHKHPLALIRVAVMVFVGVEL